MDFSLESILITVLGLLICFAGWWLFKVSLFSLGLILGSSLGYAIAVFTLQTGRDYLDETWAPWVIICTTILFGILGVLLIKTLMNLLVFLAGFLFGMAVIAFYSGDIGITMHPYDVKLLIENISILSVASGLVFGILFVIFRKGFVILFSSAVGAYLITIFVEGPHLVFYGLLIVGATVQLWMSRAERMGHRAWRRRRK